ncbi:MAG: hypothetical protein ABIH27_01570 [Candidatus Omnitrophota bacterium]
MTRIKINNRAQGVLEYVVILGVVAVALMSMTLYFRRGVQAVVKAAADELGSQSDSQSQPGRGTLTDSTSTSTVNIAHSKTTDTGGGLTDQILEWNARTNGTSSSFSAKEE